ncbi:MAG: TMEM175 family protein [Candidatus Margulisiibacteriota bacterium]
MTSAGLTTNRIEALADGIFAFSMTLLVMTLNLPDAAIHTGSLQQFLIGQGDKFFNYGMSFVLIAVVWIIHHQQFQVIRRTDQRHLWINIFLLMFVALIPFSTTLVGVYPLSATAELFFDANLFMIGSLLFLNWEYSTRGRRLIDNILTEEQIRNGWQKTLVMPLAGLLAMAIVAYDPTYSAYAYLSIPFILALPYFRSKAE